MAEENKIGKECDIAGCENKHFAKGLCEPCYQKRYYSGKKDTKEQTLKELDIIEKELEVKVGPDVVAILDPDRECVITEDKDAWEKAKAGRPLLDEKALSKEIKRSLIEKINEEPLKGWEDPVERPDRTEAKKREIAQMAKNHEYTKLMELIKTGTIPYLDMNPEKDIVKVSFKDHPELKAYLENRAARGFRTPAMELLSMLSYSFEAKKSKKA